jgi:long-subunit acyl-CoA synthetase (AMP-forming)
LTSNQRYGGVARTAERNHDGNHRHDGEITGRELRRARNDEGQEGWRLEGLLLERVLEVSRSLGLALISLGIKPGDRIAMYSPNSPEWQMVDVGALSVGAIDVPMYATITANQAEFILSDSGSRVVFVGTEDHLAKVLEVRANLPELMKIVMMYDGENSHTTSSPSAR